MDCLVEKAAFSLAAFALVVSPVAAQDDDAYRLAPASHWHLDMAEESCGLQRVFGQEGNQVYLQLRQYAPDDSLTVTVASDDVRQRSRLRNFAVTFLPDSEANESVRPMAVSSDAFGDGVLFSASLLSAEDRARRDEADESDEPFTVPEDARNAREQAIESVSIRGQFMREVVLETGSLHPAMTAMRACMDDLVESWGIDLETDSTLSRRVQAVDMDRWTRPITATYPIRSVQRGQQGYIRIRLMVSDEGRATDCVVQSAFNDRALDEAACEGLLRHSRFEPALDAMGSPVASYWTTVVIYTLG
ncbi:energy transducer TonB [Aurantiacibacter sp. D1-12]|uniref:energy transducer TonB n=1 Tax=Aurantiacibacter sp. D1-12 TaxID=2993658 RepID=UPI00237C6554|nr:energy transducer TonB [Aurantiacibacter sp. D1-12]MDE1466427.1 energy transducer TonB [Aurantiacibacter sp. D1-12]